MDCTFRFLPLRNAAGEIIGVLMIIVDVTERKRAEEQLQAAETRFRSIVEHSHEAIMLINAQGRMIYASPAITRISG